MRNLRIPQVFTLILDLYDTSVVGCSNKTDRDSNSGYKKSVNLANA